MRGTNKNPPLSDPGFPAEAGTRRRSYFCLKGRAEGGHRLRRLRHPSAERITTTVRKNLRRTLPGGRRRTSRRLRRPFRPGQPVSGPEKKGSADGPLRDLPRPGPDPPRTRPEVEEVKKRPQRQTPRALPRRLFKQSLGRPLLGQRQTALPAEVANPPGDPKMKYHRHLKAILHKRKNKKR